MLEEGALSRLSIVDMMGLLSTALSDFRSALETHHEARPCEIDNLPVGRAVGLSVYQTEASPEGLAEHCSRSRRVTCLGESVSEYYMKVAYSNLVNGCQISTSENDNDQSLIWREPGWNCLHSRTMLTLVHR